VLAVAGRVDPLQRQPREQRLQRGRALDISLRDLAARGDGDREPAAPAPHERLRAVEGAVPRLLDPSLVDQGGEPRELVGRVAFPRLRLGGCVAWTAGSIPSWRRASSSCGTEA
jgi:hypothetical protein